MVREVSNLKNSVEILEKKNRKQNNNNERSELAKIPKIDSTKASRFPLTLRKIQEMWKKLKKSITLAQQTLMRLRMKI